MRGVSQHRPRWADSTGGSAYPEGVQMSQHTHHLGETVHLQDVQELEGFHLESEGRVNQEQNLGTNRRQVSMIVVGCFLQRRITD